MCSKCDNSAIEKAFIPNLKGDKRYKDAPRFPMIYDYEGEFKKNYDKSIKVMIVDIVKAMNSFIKK